MLYNCANIKTINAQKSCSSRSMSLIYVSLSSKDPVTKKEVPPNEMERAIIDYWEELTGVRLVVRSLEERKKLGIRLR